MIARSVPVRSSLWSCTGTVVVPTASFFCMTIWLPRRRTSTKPWRERISHASRPERTRSLPNCHLDPRDVNLVAQPLLDLLGRGSLQEQLQRLQEVCPRLLDRVALTGDVQLRAKSHVAFVLALDD